MGNRCVITAAPFKASNVGIYLHRSGGIESVEAFCRAAKELGYRSPPDDTEYGFARLIGLISLYFRITGNTSIGVGKCSDLDLDGDKGTWLIGAHWEIVGWLPSSDSKQTFAPPTNEEPDRTALIYKQLVVGARLCATVFKEQTLAAY